MEGKKAVACNYAVATKICSLGALAYLINQNPGWGGDRVEILARSRGGHWIRRWEASWRLHNFRFKTIPLAKSVYDRVFDFSLYDDQWLRHFNEARDKNRGEKIAQAAGLTKQSAHCV